MRRLDAGLYIIQENRRHEVLMDQPPKIDNSHPRLFFWQLPEQEYTNDQRLIQIENLCLLYSQITHKRKNIVGLPQIIQWVDRSSTET